MNMQNDQLCINIISTSITKKLEELSPRHECCILRVNDVLRRVNEKAYEPDIIAIGPYHRDKDRLKKMEEHKLRYLQLLLRRQNTEVESYVEIMKLKEAEARKSYEEPLNLDTNQFIEMLLLDSCFIIELMRKFKKVELRGNNDPIFQMELIISTLQRDLILFENQLPLNVLTNLFDKIKDPTDPTNFFDLAFDFFSDLSPPDAIAQRLNSDEHSFKHLLELVHYNLLHSFAGPNSNQLVSDPSTEWKFVECARQLKVVGIKLCKMLLSFAQANPIPMHLNQREVWKLIKCATKLREVGFKFQKIEGGCCLFDIKYSDGIMQIPTLEILDRTESFLRNVIAYEQYDQDMDFKCFTDYVIFMDCLIKSPEDVSILCHYGIIVNGLGSEEGVSTLFNNMCGSLITPPAGHFCYDKICQDVDDYCRKNRHKRIAVLRRIYCSNPWAVLSIIAASILLLVTVIQTVFTVFPR